MKPRLSTWTVAVSTAITLAACGGGGADTADPTTTTAGDAQTTTSVASDTTVAPEVSSDSTTTTIAPTAGEAGGMIAVTVDGVDYRFSVADDISAGNTGTFFPTRCEPNNFGAGLFWVVATAVDESGARAEPNINLTLVLPHDGQGAADTPPEFELFVASTADSPLQLDYVLATEDGLAGVGGPAYDGDLGSWTVDGSRITGEVTVFEGDHVREFFTATFDITCPAP